MSIPWLREDYPELFPEAYSALKEPNGLLAAGGDLSPERLLAAYQRGIFPWYEEFLEDGSPSPILWWCPAPRCVLFIKDLKVSPSLKKSMRNRGYSISCDRAFEETIIACAESRADSEGTWINQDMIEAYTQLHRQGYAHSVECWSGEQLVGGLYGIAIGQMFFGESMFSKERDSSKTAFVALCSYLQRQGQDLIDCQIANPHLISLGASEIDLDQFLDHLSLTTNQEPLDFPKNKVKPYPLYESQFLT